MRFLAYKEETGGNYGLVEYTAGPDFQGPAAHIHPAMEEGFYVLEGEFTIQLGDSQVAAPAGTFVLIPRGLAHTFWNSGKSAAKFLLIASPGGFERYFEELVPMVEEHGYPPAESMAELARKYNFRFAAPD